MFDFNKQIWDINTKPEHTRSPSFNQICLLQYQWTGQIPWLSALKEYIKRKESVASAFFVFCSFVCFTSSLCHGFCFIPLGHTSLCVYLQSISGLVIMPFSVKYDFWIRVRRKLWDFRNLSADIYEISKTEVTTLLSVLALWPSCSLKY